MSVKRAYLMDDYEYTPDVDGEELIEKLYLVVLQHLRWGTLKSLLATYDRDGASELLIEGLICKLVWKYVDYSSITSIERQEQDRRCFISTLIYIYGFDLMPYAKYRKDHAPHGDWSKRGFPDNWNDPVVIDALYQQACEDLYKWSKAELMRD